jgi:hypothetical protein
MRHPNRALSAETLALMRELITETVLSQADIGRRCGVSASTVCRHARAARWTRPAGARRSTAAAAAEARVAPASASDRECPEPMTPERRRAVIAALWRVVETQTQHLVAEGRARPSDLKLLVDVTGRLTQLEEQARKDEPPPPAAYEGPATFDDVNRIIAEITERFYAFGEEQEANGTWDDEDESETGDRAGDARRH